MSDKDTVAAGSTGPAVGGFDLSSLDVVSAANTGVEVDLLHPVTNEPIGMKIKVIGRDSDEFRRLSNAQSRRRVNKMSKGGFRATNANLEDVEAEGIELLAACTKGWTNVVVSGKVIPFSKEAAVDLYTKYPWIKEQVDTAIGDRALFITV